MGKANEPLYRFLVFDLIIILQATSNSIFQYFDHHAQLFIFKMGTVFLQCVPFYSYGQLQLSDDFEGGNARLFTKSTDTLIQIRSTHKLKDTKNVWVYGKISNVPTDRTITNQILPEQDNYLNEEVVFSYDQQHWKKLKGQADQEKRVFSFRKKFDEDTIYLATTYPYLYTDLLDYLGRLEPSDDLAKSWLCYSPMNRPVPLVRFGPAHADHMVWIICRQHAFEHPTSFFMEGIMDVLSTSKAHQTLKDRMAFYLVPLMDVDAVAEGATGKDQLPIDMNRNCDLDKAYWPQINAVKDKLFQKALDQNMLAFIDLHSPFPHNNGSHYYTTFPKDHPNDQNLSRFYSLYKKRIDQGFWRHETGLAPSRARGRTWGGKGIPALFPDQDFSCTNEQAFHKAGTQTLYTKRELRAFGMDYAQALIDYLETR